MTLVFRAGNAGGEQFLDVQSMMASILRGWPHQTVQTSPGPGRGHQVFIETEAVRLDTGVWSTGHVINGTVAPNTIGIGLVDGDPSQVRFCGRSLTPFRIPLVQPGVEFEFAAPPSIAAMVLTIDRAVFERHAEALVRTDMTPGSSYELCLPSPEHGMNVVLRLKAILSELRRLPASVQSPQVSKLVTDDILSLLLTSTTPMLQRIDPPHRQHLARKAASMLRQEANSPLSIRELCERLGINWRTLNMGFRELYGVPPKTYMRLSRLHHVRRVLSEADPATTNVTAVAVSWGFFQLGRFAVEYRQLFGEKPSDTLWKYDRLQPVQTLRRAV
ncbi:helix-turn-helix domain-containing protein [Azospirillum sp. RWY-5-1]|uniref:Helix-turn-helix domain-containing protein n=1 Tax=Azospirillum oleiclasticum TaxID=2735135 RepID=A0ABX2T234_9PROT|nr:helix-turn-helix domain-containing protein [Azospirillum oleiclasticum]NYZ11151.1 helix-turn-helix domain-containing protein [Azospirillum oleiclasticum]NYZ18313.1 helix-turn-helix domain-containing protein [Azospirillum oleiclasticum]